MASQEAREVEEHYILRVKDPQLAERIRAALQGRSEEPPGKAELRFEGKLRGTPPAPMTLAGTACLPARHARRAHRPPLRPRLRLADDDKHGKFIFEGQEFPLTVLSLPCVTETYKTYDEVNYVKVTDVGQVRWVGAGGARRREIGG